ncbi:MAG: toll/interleukin-1 receptor domain-containing protein, partial [Pseudomonadota bacterium]
MPHIFISYSSKHRPLTERLAAALEAEGWPVWWDHALEAHSSFRTQIDQAINDAAAFMVIWNKEAAASGFVLGEVQTARRRGQLINLRPLDFDIDDVPAEYRNIDHLLPLDFNHLAPILKTVETVWAGRVPEGMKPLWLSHRDLHGVDLFDPKQTPLPRPENPNPTDILQARHEVVPYIDAAGILADTLDWVRNRGTYAARPRPAAGRLFHGPGGFGKTRAMIEAARILRGEGWLAGFYPPLGAEATEDERKHRRRAMEQAVFAEGPERGILILVDYAESRADVRAPFEERRSDDITWLIRLIRRRPEDARPLRLVLLARGDAWWPDVFRAEPEVQALFDRTGAKHGDVIAADALPDGETRLKLFDATRTAYAAHLGTDPPLPPERRARIATDPTYARPLALQMEALLSLMGGVANTVDELLKGVLGLEHLHWTNVLGTLSDKQVGSMRRGLSQVTLVGSVDGRGAAAALLKADAYYPDRSTADLPLSDLRRLYGLGKHGVAALEPDLIGEHEVASVGEDDGEALVDACLAWIATLPEAERAHRRQLLFTVLQRATRAEHGAEADEAEAMLAHVLTDPDADTITDLVSVAIETPGRLAALLEQAAARLPPAALSALEDAVPAETIALAGVADAAAAVREGQAR